ncbi:BQ2448_2960 [Microbotryum intermedium]|uniref:BQ2448_2960 protein n=1 Tax=Microbotryum intermedium TaxID=269621 RepID=A0A238FBZ8_9BASI|nr:BQ2448_2960 [Microbotryum intermedium]
MQEVFGMEQTQFIDMSQRAQASGEESRHSRYKHARDLHRDRLKKEQTHRVDATGTYSWVHGTARLAQEFGIRGRNRPKFKLAVAAAERPPRPAVKFDSVDLYSEVKEQDPTSRECTHFLACDGTEFDRSEVPWDRVLLIKLILDLHDHVLPQPTRMFAPGLAVNEHDAHLVVRDHEVCRIARGSGFGDLSATLSVLLDLDVYSAGFAPFLRYEYPLKGGITAVSLLTSVFQSSSQEGSPGQALVGAPTTLTGRTVGFEDEEPIELVSYSAAHSDSVFGSFTTVFRLTQPSLQVASGPAGSLKPSCAHDSGVLSPKVVDHLAMLEVAASLRPHRSQVDEDLLPRRKATGWYGYYDDNMVRIRLNRRTLDLLILRNPTPAPRPLASGPGVSLDSSPPLEHVLHVFDQLLTVLVALHAGGFYHRDLSLEKHTPPRGPPLLGDRIPPDEHGTWSKSHFQPNPTEDRKITHIFLTRALLWAKGRSLAFDSRACHLASIRCAHLALGDVVDYMTQRWPKPKRTSIERKIAAIQRRVRKLAEAEGGDRRGRFGTFIEALTEM